MYSDPRNNKEMDTKIHLIVFTSEGISLYITVLCTYLHYSSKVVVRVYLIINCGPNISEK